MCKCTITMWNRLTIELLHVLYLQIIQVLFDGGLDIGNIGVISPYNAQVDLIQRVARKEGFPETEVHTVDKYQVDIR
jgi:superfamily I DNA and/or RNA helicase